METNLTFILKFFIFFTKHYPRNELYKSPDT